MLDSFGQALRQLLLAPLAILALLISGCGSADDESSLVRRVSDALVEVGASPALTRCLTENLGDHLTEADAEAAYEDLASEPEVSEISLNRISLDVKAVRKHLLGRARRCRSSLVSRGRYTRSEVDRMLRSVSARGYREPRLFLEK
jgi:hypothetical protein